MTDHKSNLISWNLSDRKKFYLKLKVWPKESSTKEFKVECKKASIVFLKRNHKSHLLY